MIEGFALPNCLWIVMAITQFLYFCQLAQLCNEVTFEILALNKDYALQKAIVDHEVVPQAWAVHLVVCNDVTRTCMYHVK